MINDYESFLKLAKQRYSVRKFDTRPVEQEKIDKIIEAGRIAPTACNRQPQRILVINDEQSINVLKKCTLSHFECKLAMLVCCDTEECWKREYDGKSSADVDASIVTAHMMLAAASLGVGSTWVMHFIPEAVRTEFEIPDNYEAVSLLVMGYPAPDAVPSPRHEDKKDIQKTVFYGKFN